MNCKPIGFFDSGVGGISVLKTAYKLMPNENYIYYGDNLNAPYGEKSEEEIKALSLEAGAFLFSKGVKAIVMACNTATSTSVYMMREQYSIPVISMEPAVKPAMNAVKDGRVLVLATPATVSQERYLSLLDKLKAGDRVISVGCGGLVELIEQGRTDEASVHTYLERKLSSIRDEKISAVVLGCTHYAFAETEIKSYIDKTYNTDCPVFDGRHGTVRQLKRVLLQNGLECAESEKGNVTYYSSDKSISTQHFKQLFDGFNS
jgi:glutamate racemase